MVPWPLTWGMLLLISGQDVQTSKELACPELPRNSVGICVEECETNDDCELRGQKGHWCCSNGCGHSCTMPERVGAIVAPAKRFEIIAVLLKDAAFADVLHELPRPFSKSELRSLHMLTVKYGAGNARDACQAFRKLSAHVKVSSVEWDASCTLHVLCSVSFCPRLNHISPVPLTAVDASPPRHCFAESSMPNEGRSGQTDVPFSMRPSATPFIPSRLRPCPCPPVRQAHGEQAVVQVQRDQPVSQSQPPPDARKMVQPESSRNPPSASTVGNGETTVAVFPSISRKYFRHTPSVGTWAEYDLDRMSCTWRRPELKDQALQETGYFLTAFLDPEALGTLSCVSHTWAGPASSFDWAGCCQADFGAVCSQYLRYLELDSHAVARFSWRSLYLRLRAFHRQLDAFPNCLQHRFSPEAWRNAPSVRLSQDACRLVQGGHSVLFCGDAEHVGILSMTSAAGSSHPSFRPADFLDVVPVTPHSVIGVSLALDLERWCFKEKASCTGRSPTGLEKEDHAEDLRLFVEHVAARLFVFAGIYIHAFDLLSLEKTYVVSAPSWERHAEQLLARWDYGEAFVAYQVEGCEACIWSTSDGEDLGKITPGNQLLCCDITSFTFGGSKKLVATLETDGGIRVFTNAQSEWRLAQAVQTLSLVVEVKLERHLLVAVSHSAGTGSVHVWHLGFDTNSSDPDVVLLLQEYCQRDCSQPPDRVEARHGGRFIEVQFLTEGLSVDGIYDVEWLEPSRLRCLLTLKSCIGDWRCDLRDAIGVLGNDSEGTVLRWLLLWQPLHSIQANMHSSMLSLPGPRMDGRGGLDKLSCHFSGSHIEDREDARLEQLISAASRKAAPSFDRQLNPSLPALRFRPSVGTWLQTYPRRVMGMGAPQLQLQDAEAVCDGVSAAERAAWCVENLGLSSEDAQYRIMNEFPLKFPKGLWSPSVLCDGHVAEERALWCMEHLGMSVEEAQCKVLSEFQLAFSAAATADSGDDTPSPLADVCSVQPEAGATETDRPQHISVVKAEIDELLAPDGNGWDPGVMCDGVSAGDRARWCVSELGLTARQARLECTSHPMVFDHSLPANSVRYDKQLLIENKFSLAGSSATSTAGWLLAIMSKENFLDIEASSKALIATQPGLIKRQLEVIE
ncbi:hypothetical protein AK812_SmicGene20600 [Symbiodinium microadriaticum]|uniref:WAP domain-containing protein n=1 Tax=Symbiodinium microadriaticum TaxID=2951 RepID=A0A1Q9DPH3_SYMMI|nr:hypothetical protein AK812_SmicGene20600 [Symbiodinium microadriaticum]